MSLHLEKKAIRTLGVAESFRKDQEYSTLVGVVMRSDLVIDGFAIGRLTVSGNDATKTVFELFRKLQRNDVNAIITSGSVLSLYNILDISAMYNSLKVPVVALSFHKARSNLYRNIGAKFSPAIAKEKIKLLERLGKSTQLKLDTGYKVFVRFAGMNDRECQRLLNKFTRQGTVPEPIRVARLLAKTVSSFQC